MATPSTTDIYETTDSTGLVRGQTFNVVSDYRWTLNERLRKSAASSLKEVPYVNLYEYEVDESTIKTQLSYYLTQGKESLTTDGTISLKPYEELFPRKETGNRYKFPYFSETNFEVNTPVWASLDTLEQGSKFAESIAGVLGGEAAANITGAVIQGAGAGVGAALSLAYPKVGIMDRPKLWQSHDFRSINIRFPLFNTVDADDWKNNRALCWTLVNQNLFFKRDFITGFPPVYYEVLIPGQHYSYAACVTNITINNRGNMRALKDDGGVDNIVPDVYEVVMTLTDMVMPSRNLLKGIQEKAKKIVVE